jgi:hypothetical protein
MMFIAIRLLGVSAVWLVLFVVLLLWLDEGRGGSIRRFYEFFVHGMTDFPVSRVVIKECLP